MQLVIVQTSANNFIEFLSEVVSSLHIEFVLFVVAIIVYVSASGPTFAESHHSKVQGKVIKQSASEIPRTLPASTVNPMSSLHGKSSQLRDLQGKSHPLPAQHGESQTGRSLFHAMMPLIRQNASREELLRFLRERLSGFPAKVVTVQLTKVLESLGRPPATAALLRAVCDYGLQERALQFPEKAVEHLLRGFLALQLFCEFENLLAEFKTVDPGLNCSFPSPAVREMALRSALKREDLDLAMGRFKSTSAIQEVPQCTIQQLAKLIRQKRPVLLEELLGALGEHRLTCETLNTLLAESVKCGDSESFRLVERIGRAGSVHFNTVTYCTLIEHRDSVHDIDRLIDEAMSHGFATKGILEKAAAIAAENRDTELAEVVTRRLPTDKTEVVIHMNAIRALVRFHFECGIGNPESKASSDAAVLELYDRCLTGVEITDPQTAHRIRDAAVCLQRGDVTCCLH